MDLETRGNTLMVAGSLKYAEVIEATAKRFRDRPERERRRSPSPRSAIQHRISLAFPGTYEKRLHRVGIPSSTCMLCHAMIVKEAES